MKIYFIERITVADLMAGGDAPEAGDIVYYFRGAQMMSGPTVEDAAGEGIDIRWAPGLLAKSDFDAIDNFLARYLNQWFFKDGADISLDGELSLGTFLTNQLALVQKPTLILALGEICRRALADMASPATILTDFVDGVTPFADQLDNGDICPRRRIIRDISSAAGFEFRDITVANPIPPNHRSGQNSKTGYFLKLARSWLGGFRPAYFMARWGARHKRDNRSRIYVYLLHGQNLIAQQLLKSASAQIFGDRKGGAGITPLRYDHLLARPSPGLKSAAGRLHARLAEIKAAAAAELFEFNRFDYRPYLVVGIERLINERLPLNLIEMAQAKKMMELYRLKTIILCGDTPAMFAQMAYAKQNGTEIISVDHSINTFRQGLRCTTYNMRHVTYVVPGTDHLESYLIDHADDDKANCAVIGNPSTVAMNGAIAKVRAGDSKRVLLSNYTPRYANTCGSFHYSDQYMIDLLEVAKRLINGGYSVSYRPHHGEEPEYLRYMIDQMDLTGRIAIDSVPDFADAIGAHDVFAANTTSCIYQALYAGRPTIFYDPVMDHDYFVGLPNADDIFRPIARSPAELEGLIVKAFDPESEVAKFPEKFRSVYAERFIGPHASDADLAIAEFIRPDVGGGNNSIAAA